MMSIFEAKAAKLRKTLRRNNSLLTPAVRESVARVRPTGLAGLLGKIRNAGVAERIGIVGHNSDYISAVMEAASESEADEVDVRRFVKHFLAKDPVFSNSDVGMAATQFEAWLIDEESEAFKQLLETVAEPGKPDFLAIFQGKLKPDVWDSMREGTAEFVTLKMLIEAGQVSNTEHERSDVTIISGVPGTGTTQTDDSDAASMPDDPMNPPKDSGYTMGGVVPESESYEVDPGESHIQMLHKLAEDPRAGRWNNLPPSFLSGALKRTKEQIRPHLNATGNNYIRARTSLAKAKTYEELHAAIEKLRPKKAVGEAAGGGSEEQGHPDLPSLARKPYAVFQYAGGSSEPSIHSFHDDKKSAVKAATAGGGFKDIYHFPNGHKLKATGQRQTGRSNSDGFKYTLRAIWKGGHDAAHADNWNAEKKQYEKVGQYGRATDELGLDDPERKPVHAQTYKEYVGDEDDSNGVLKRMHREAIERAMKFGKRISPEVLKDHPGLHEDTHDEAINLQAYQQHLQQAGFTAVKDPIIKRGKKGISLTWETSGEEAISLHARTTKRGTIKTTAAHKGKDGHTLLHTEELTPEQLNGDPDSVFPKSRLEELQNSQGEPFIQGLQNITSRYGTWRIEQDREDPEKVNILFGEPRRAFTVSSPLQEAEELVRSIAQSYPNMPAEFDTMTEGVLREYAEDNGTLLYDEASLHEGTDAKAINPVGDYDRRGRGLFNDLRFEQVVAFNRIRLSLVEHTGVNEIEIDERGRTRAFAKTHMLPRGANRRSRHGTPRIGKIRSGSLDVVGPGSRGVFAGRMRREALEAEIAKQLGIDTASIDEGTKDPKTMPASMINKELDKLDSESSKHTDAMIAAGRGSERPSEWMSKTDDLSKAMRSNYERRSALRNEIESRYGSSVHRLPQGRGFGPRLRESEDANAEGDRPTPEPYETDKRYKFVERYRPTVGDPLHLFDKFVGVVDAVRQDESSKLYVISVRPVSEEGDRILDGATGGNVLSMGTTVESLTEFEEDSLLIAAALLEDVTAPIDTASMLVEHGAVSLSEFKQLLDEGVATSRIGDRDKDKLATHYDRWIRQGDNYKPSGPVQIEKSLDKFAYKATVDMMGTPIFIRVRPQTDELYKFPNSIMEQTLGEIDKFWDLKDDYEKLGLMYNRGVLMHGPPGCHAKGHPILMYDATIKLVEDVQVGDKLMGPDAKPRTVLELVRGREDMFEVTGCYSKPFVVNRHHILSLRKSFSGDGFEMISVSLLEAPRNVTVDYYVNNQHALEDYRLWSVSPNVGGTTHEVAVLRDFRIRPVGEGDYYGFALTGDHLYCDGEGMVHHNTGKTSIVHQVAEMIVERGDICFYARDIGPLHACLTALREVEPNRKVVVILEDADEFLRHSEREFLQLLDGEQSIQGVLYLATTNYIERFPPRLLRPGRFDEHIFVGYPPEAGRKAYLSAKLNKVDEGDDEIDRLAKETEGMSFGHLRELVTAVYALKQPVDKVLARLRKTAPLPELETRDDGPLVTKRGYVESLAPKAMARLAELQESEQPVDENAMHVVTDDPVIALELIDWLTAKGLLKASLDAHTATENTGTFTEGMQTP